MLSSLIPAVMEVAGSWRSKMKQREWRACFLLTVSPFRRLEPLVSTRAYFLITTNGYCSRRFHGVSLVYSYSNSSVHGIQGRSSRCFHPEALLLECLHLWDFGVLLLCNVQWNGLGDGRGMQAIFLHQVGHAMSVLWSCDESPDTWSGHSLAVSSSSASGFWPSRMLQQYSLAWGFQVRPVACRLAGTLICEQSG